MYKVIDPRTSGDNGSFDLFRDAWAHAQELADERDAAMEVHGPKGIATFEPARFRE